MFLRDVVILCLALAVGALSILAYGFQRRCKALETRMVAAEVTLSSHRMENEARFVAIGSELGSLEIAVFGTKPPPPVMTHQVPGWSVNRDRWFNSRLAALEQWRLEQQAKDGK